MFFNFKTKKEKALEKELTDAYQQLFELSRELARFKGSTTWSFNANVQFQEILKNSLYEASLKTKPIWNPLELPYDEQPFWAK